MAPGAALEQEWVVAGQLSADRSEFDVPGCRRPDPHLDVTAERVEVELRRVDRPGHRDVDPTGERLGVYGTGDVVKPQPRRKPLDVVRAADPPDLDRAAEHLDVEIGLVWHFNLEIGLDDFVVGESEPTAPAPLLVVGDDLDDRARLEDVQPHALESGARCTANGADDDLVAVGAGDANPAGEASQLDPPAVAKRNDPYDALAALRRAVRGHAEERDRQHETNTKNDGNP